MDDTHDRLDSFKLAAAKAIRETIEMSISVNTAFPISLGGAIPAYGAAPLANGWICLSMEATRKSSRP